jgi:hypothetical protein
MRGSEEECPEKTRLGFEIMQLLVKRETSLAEALDALTAVMLNTFVTQRSVVQIHPSQPKLYRRVLA